MKGIMYLVIGILYLLAAIGFGVAVYLNYEGNRDFKNNYLLLIPAALFLFSSIANFFLYYRNKDVRN